MKVETNPIVDGSETFDLHLSNINMWQEVVKVIKYFLEFFKTFDFQQIHNIFALMLDPCVKSLRVVKKIVGHGNANYHVAKYNVKKIIPLFMIVFYQLNLMVHPNNVHNAN
jgi:hypothetical protein